MFNYISILFLSLFISFNSNASFVKKINAADISPEAGVIDPYKVRFTQDSIAGDFSDGSSVFDMIRKIREGKVDVRAFAAIKVFVKDGIFYSLDNRRLYVFQQVGAPIKYELITNPEAIAKEAFKFTTENDGREIIVRVKAKIIKVDDEEGPRRRRF